MPDASFSLLTTARYDRSLLQHGASSPIYLPDQHHVRLLAAARAFGFSNAITLLESSSPSTAIQSWIEAHLVEAYGSSTPEGPLRLKLRLSFPFHPHPHLQPTTIPPSATSPSTSPTTTYRPHITSGPTPALPTSAFFPTAFGHPSALHETHPELHRWTLYVLPHPFTAPTHPSTAHKTDARASYSAVRSELDCALAEQAKGSERASDDGKMPEVLLPTLIASDGAEIAEGSLTTPFFFRGGAWVTPRAAAGGCVGVARRWALGRGRARGAEGSPDVLSPNPNPRLSVALGQELCAEGIVPASSVTVGERVWVGNGVRGFSWGVVEPWPGEAGGV